jgi:hypothetical protein
LRLADAIDELLECSLDGIDPPVCRSFKNPGPDAPHDVCEKAKDGSTDGQLWIAHLGSNRGWPSPTGEPVICSAPFSEQIEIGIVRCAMSKLTDQGRVPAEELVTADADQQESDRLAIRNAILCCAAIEGRDMIIAGWQPIPPQGGCVGGIWTLFVRDAGCDCSNLESS